MKKIKKGGSKKKRDKIKEGKKIKGARERVREREGQTKTEKEYTGVKRKEEERK